MIFAASDSGLLFIEANQSRYFDVINPTYFSVEGIDTAYTVKYSRYYNSIWVGTNNGIVELAEDNLQQEQFVIGDIGFDTLELCRDIGSFMRVDINDQIQMQWYRNNSKINGAVSNNFIAFEPGLYSIIYDDSGEEVTKDVSFVKYDSTFNESLDTTEILLCPGAVEFLIINDVNDQNSYNWYSVERGFEVNDNTRNQNLRVTSGGNYYFIATNCNGFEFISDTLTVRESDMTLPFFDENLPDIELCSNDTIFIQGGENAVSYKWQIGNDRLSDNDFPYYVVSPGDANRSLLVTVVGPEGCENFLDTNVPYVHVIPAISPENNTYEICEEKEIVVLIRPEFTRVDWEGENENGNLIEVGEGSYNVNVINDLCGSNESVVFVNRFSPLPIDDIPSVLPISDTLKIPINDINPIDWEGDFTLSDDGNFLLLSSLVSTVLKGSITYSNGRCERVYDLEVEFSDVLSVNPNRKELSIYPNPTKNELFIQNAGFDKYDEISFMNMSGKIVYQTTLSNHIFDKVTIPNQLKNGIYILRLTGKGVVFSKRLIIDK
ncbi:MAG: T9SS type A sorting domain-containing protein [Bacteroidota bacterium]